MRSCGSDPEEKPVAFCYVYSPVILNTIKRRGHSREQFAITSSHLVLISDANLLVSQTSILQFTFSSGKPLLWLTPGFFVPIAQKSFPEEPILCQIFRSDP